MEATPTRKCCWWPRQCPYSYENSMQCKPSISWLPFPLLFLPWRWFFIEKGQTMMTQFSCFWLVFRITNSHRNIWSCHLQQTASTQILLRRGPSSPTWNMWPVYQASCTLTKARTVWPETSPRSEMEAHQAAPNPAHELPAPPTCTPRSHVPGRTRVAWASCGKGMDGRKYLWIVSFSGSTLWRWWEWPECHQSSTQPGCSPCTSSPSCPLYVWSSHLTTPCCLLLDLPCRTSLSSSFGLLWLPCLAL